MTGQALANAIREQCGWCERLGSPLYHALLTRIAADVEASGICWKILEPFAGDPARSLLPLRFLAAIHRLVLEGRLPKLEQYYPSAGGTADPEAACVTLLEALEQHGDLVRASLPETVQTNEVSRCCALLPGFLEIARATGLPLRLLEIGCSAGLNLRWDRYRYATPQGAWGPADSPVVFANPFSGPPPPNRLLSSAAASASKKASTKGNVCPRISPEGSIKDAGHQPQASRMSLLGPDKSRSPGCPSSRSRSFPQAIGWPQHPPKRVK